MSAAPYDILEIVLNAARVRLNDAIASLAGDVFTDAQPFTLVVANNGWRKLQEELANLGYTRLKAETILLNITAGQATDPAIQSWINWAGYFDGVNLNASPVLPQDFIAPLKVYERLNGQNAPFGPEMENMADGLRQWIQTKSVYNYQWEWRGDAIYFNGSLQAEDFRILYQAYLPNFATLSAVAITAASNQNPVLLTSPGHGLFSGETVTITGATGGWTGINVARVATVLDRDTFSVPVNTTAFGALSGAPVFATAAWQSRPVPIMRCLDALANFMCAEMAKARGDVDGAQFVADGRAALDLIVNRDARAKQRVNLRRQSRSGRLEGGGNFY